MQVTDSAVVVVIVTVILHESKSIPLQKATNKPPSGFPGPCRYMHCNISVTVILHESKSIPLQKATNKPPSGFPGPCRYMHCNISVLRAESLR